MGGKEASHKPSDFEKDSLSRAMHLSFLCVEHNEGQWKPALGHTVFT